MNSAIFHNGSNPRLRREHGFFQSTSAMHKNPYGFDAFFARYLRLRVCRVVARGRRDFDVLFVTFLLCARVLLAVARALFARAWCACFSGPRASSNEAAIKSSLGRAPFMNANT